MTSVRSFRTADFGLRTPYFVLRTFFIRMRLMFGTRALGAVLVVAVAGLPVLPPEHVHEAEDHGHEHLLVHRHLAAHGDRHQASHENVIDESDWPVLTLPDTYVVPAITHVVSVPATADVAFIQPPPSQPISRTRDCVEHLIHGPPRAPTGLRAPPPLSRL